jgi:hypothetical protein
MDYLFFILIYFKDYSTTYIVRTAPVSYYTIIIEALALAAVILNSRDLNTLTQISYIVHNKECS